MSSNSISYKNLKTCRYLLKFSYIGTKYKGIQRMSKREDIYSIRDETIQTAIETNKNRNYFLKTALQTQLRPIYGSRMSVSSRTDSGVHALMNTGHVDLTHPFYNTVYKPSFITDSVNEFLIRNGDEIMILSTQMVPNYFHSRRDAKYREYIYRLAILNSQIGPNRSQYLDSLLPISELNRCYIISRPNFNEMERVINLFNGEHDFASFTPKPKSKEIVIKTIKTIDKFELKMSNDLVFINNEKIDSNISLWIFCVKSKSFLYNQIRRMVGSVIDVGLNRQSYERIEWMLKNPSNKNWGLYNTVAPAKGLWLTNIYYDQNDLILKESDDEFHPHSNPYYNYDNYSDSE